MQEKEKEGEYIDIDIKLIDEPEGRVRLDIDSDSIDELADNIREVGLIQPIVVVQSGERYEIVAGHRRFLAHKKIGYEKIKAIIKKLSKPEIALSRASENLMREDLSPIEVAAIYTDLYNEFQLTCKSIGDKFGVAGMTIKRRMDLLRLPDNLQEAIHNRKISVGVGEVLARIEDKKELKRYLDLAIENGVTVDVAKTWTDDFRKSLQYIDNREELPPPDVDIIEQRKFYTTCQICEEPIEYQDICVVKMCRSCFDDLIKALKV